MAACTGRGRADHPHCRPHAADRALECGNAAAAHGTVAARPAHRKCSGRSHASKIGAASAAGRRTQRTGFQLAPGPGGGRRGGTSARCVTVAVDSRKTSDSDGGQIERPSSVRGLQPRTLRTHPPGTRYRLVGPPERPGDRARTGTAGLQRNVDRSSHRRRRSGSLRRTRPAARAAGPSSIWAAASVAQQPRKNRVSTSASPTRVFGRCAISRIRGRYSARKTGTSTRP